MNAVPRNPRLAYRQAAVETATPLGLVVILYDLAIEDCRKSIAAINSADVQGRTNAVQHAFQVIEQLQGRLDFEKGGEVAKQLDRFYSMVRGKLLEAQIKCSRQIFEEVIGFLWEMRQTWKQVEEQCAGEQGAPAAPGPAAIRVMAPAPTEAQPSGVWSA